MTLKFKTCMHGYESYESCNEAHAKELAKLHSLCEKMASTLEFIVAEGGCKCDAMNCVVCRAKEALKEYHSGKGERR